MVTRNSRISVTHREGDLWQLAIKNVKPSDQGWYMCQINTDPMESQVGYLEVTGTVFFKRRRQLSILILSNYQLSTEPPSFNDDECNGDVTVKEGQSANFICSANGFPRPIISWKREDDRPISGAKAGNHKQDE